MLFVLDGHKSDRVFLNVFEIFECAVHPFTSIVIVEHFLSPFKSIIHYVSTSFKIVATLSAVAVSYNGCERVSEFGQV